MLGKKSGLQPAGRYGRGISDEQLEEMEKQERVTGGPGKILVALEIDTDDETHELQESDAESEEPEVVEQDDGESDSSEESGSEFEDEPEEEERERPAPSPRARKTAPPKACDSCREKHAGCKRVEMGKACVCCVKRGAACFYMGVELPRADAEAYDSFVPPPPRKRARKSLPAPVAEEHHDDFDLFEDLGPLTHEDLMQSPFLNGQGPAGIAAKMVPREAPAARLAYEAARAAEEEEEEETSETSEAEEEEEEEEPVPPPCVLQAPASPGLCMPEDFEDYPAFDEDSFGFRFSEILDGRSQTNYADAVPLVIQELPIEDPEEASKVRPPHPEVFANNLWLNLELN